VLPLRSKYLPVSQDVHTAAPTAAEKVLRPQDTHTVALSSSARYVPTGQSVQLVMNTCAVLSEYLPASHLMHVEVRSIAVLYVPAAQSMHASKPSVSAYLPSTQPRHVVCPIPGWYLPASHFRHAEPNSGTPYVPWPHGRHMPAPATSVYLPSPQLVQEDAPMCTSPASAIEIGVILQGQIRSPRPVLALQLGAVFSSR